MSFLDSLNTSVLEGLLPQQSANKLPLVTCTIERLVEPEDLAEYCQKVNSGELLGPNGSGSFDLQKLRARHHSVARLLAQGVPEGVVAQISRFNPAYISQLKNSPAMQELIAHYRGPGQEAAAVLGEKLRTAADASLELLMDRMESSPDELSAADLVAISKLGLDRSGHGPQSSVKVNSEHHHIDHAELAKLKQSVRENEAKRITRSVQPGLPPPDSQ